MAKRKTKTKRETLVSFLLDETGSMGMIKDQTIKGFNEYVSALNLDKDNKYRMNFVKFNSSKTEKVCVGAAMKDVPVLDDHNYRPNAITPLIDAAMALITATEEYVASLKEKLNVLVVLQTDGQENASIKFKFTDLAAKIKEMEKKGWEFIFLGADIDAYDAGAAMGIGVANTMSYGGADHTADAFGAMAANTRSYANSGGVKGMAAFSVQQKSASGDRFASVKVTTNKGVPKSKPTLPKDGDSGTLVDDLDFTAS